VIREFASLEAPIILVNSEDGAEEEFTLGDLLPRSFGPEDLSRE
jgi:cytidine deaminase